MINTEDKMICRACFCDDPKLLQPFLANTNNLAIYTSCTYLQITNNDNLPKYLCLSCTNKCKSWNSFKEMCTENESLLINKFNNHKSIKGIFQSLITEEKLPADDLGHLGYISADNRIKNIKLELHSFEEINVKNEIHDDSSNSSKNNFINLQNNKSSKMLNNNIINNLVSINNLDSHFNVDQKKKPKNLLTKCTKRNQSKKFKYHLQESIEFICEICNKSFKSRNNIRNHLKIHIKSCLCELCGKIFREKPQLNMHMFQHTVTSTGGEFPHKCSICNKGFIKKYNLKIHERIHTGERPYLCILCNKTYHVKRNLNNHMKIHVKEPPIKCSECNKSFYRNSDLKSHCRIHTGEKLYDCKICFKKFSTSSKLKRHNIKHTGERPFQCNICNKGLTRKSYLIVHMRTHTGEKPYVCSMCPKAYNVKHCLVSHMATHSGERLFSRN